MSFTIAFRYTEPEPGPQPSELPEIINAHLNEDLALVMSLDYPIPASRIVQLQRSNDDDEHPLWENTSCSLSVSKWRIGTLGIFSNN